MVTASSVSEALRVLRAEEVSLAIIDVFLHGESGSELLRGIVAARPELPVIIISGISYEHPLFQEALEAGAADVFTKTLPLSQLLTEVRRVI